MVHKQHKIKYGTKYGRQERGGRQKAGASGIACPVLIYVLEMPCGNNIRVPSGVMCGGYVGGGQCAVLGASLGVRCASCQCCMRCMPVLQRELLRVLEVHDVEKWCWDVICECAALGASAGVRCAACPASSM